MEQSVAELFREVWAHPDDDQIRLVLADALLAIDDPRGEFIQLQFQPQRQQGSRAMRLLQAHGLSWLGALRGAVTPIAYERGFVASCKVYDATGVVGVGEWSTIHTIDLPHDGDHDFLFDPVMRSLRRLERASAELVRRLGGHPLAERIDKLELGWDVPWSPALHRDLVALPVVREVRFHDPQQIWTRGDNGRLSTLVASYEDGLIDVLRQLPANALERFAIHDAPAADRAAIEAAVAAQTGLRDLRIATRPQPEVYED